MKNEHITTLHIDFLSKMKERENLTRNNYRKYHKLPMYRGNVKYKKRLNTFKVSYIDIETMDTDRCFSRQ